MPYVVRIARVDLRGGELEQIGAEASARGYSLPVACSRAIASLVGTWKDSDLVTDFGLNVKVQHVSGRVNYRRRDVRRDPAYIEESARLLEAKGDHAGAAELRKTLPPTKDPT